MTCSTLARLEAEVPSAKEPLSSRSAIDERRFVAQESDRRAQHLRSTSNVLPLRFRPIVHALRRPCRTSSTTRFTTTAPAGRFDFG